MKDMEDYLNDCIDNGFTSEEIRETIMNLYKEIHKRYPNLLIDAAPGPDGNDFMLALDDGTNHLEFEYMNGNWETFYRNRSTEEEIFEEVKDPIKILEKLDYIIKRFKQ